MTEHVRMCNNSLLKIVLNKCMIYSRWIHICLELKQILSMKHIFEQFGEIHLNPEGWRLKVIMMNPNDQTQRFHKLLNICQSHEPVSQVTMT